MRAARITPSLVLPALFALTGCGYVHVGRIPPAAVTVIGDEQLLQDNSALRREKQVLQQELALTRAQGEALRMAIENRAADGDTTRRVVERLNQASRDLALLRASYGQLQTERDQAIATAGEANTLKARLAATEEKLATSLRTYTELQDEVVRLRTDVARSRDENIALSDQVKVITAQNEQAQAALAQLNTDLLAQKNARYEAEQDATALRTELKAVAPDSSVLAQHRTGAAGEAQSLVAEHAAETAALKAQLETLAGQVHNLEAERAQLQQQLAKAGEPALAAAAIEARLVTTDQENEQLRAASARLATEKSELENQLARLQAAAPPSLALREQLRAAQARAAVLTEENARLKSRLAVAATPPAGAAAAPLHPAPPPAVAVARAQEPTFEIRPLPERSAAPTVVMEASRIDLGSDAAPRADASAASRGTSTVNARLVTSAKGRSRAPALSDSDADGERVHVVSGGDTLAKISALYYGTPSRWADILAANRDVLGESNNLIVGRTLRIP